MASNERYRNYRDQISEVSRQPSAVSHQRKGTEHRSEPSASLRAISKAPAEPSARLGCDLGGGRCCGFGISKVGLAQNLEAVVEFVAQWDPCWYVEF